MAKSAKMTTVVANCKWKVNVRFIFDYETETDEDTPDEFSFFSFKTKLTRHLARI